MRRFLRGLVLSLLAWGAACTTASAAPAQPTIANGLPTTEHPEVAILLTEGGSCSATLIGCLTAITAAHCVCVPAGSSGTCPDGEPLLAPDQMSVFVPQAGFFPVSSVHVHPGYDFAISSDLALLCLGSRIRAIEPARINDTAAPSPGNPATLVGFGRTGSLRTDAGVKRIGAATIDVCTAADVPEQAHVCWNFDPRAGPPGSESNICPGDSGGPLFADLGVGVALVGVHSGGTSSECSEGSSSFDADVYFDHAWIEDQSGLDLGSARCGDGPQVGDPSVATVLMQGITSSPATHSFSVPAGTKLLRLGLNGEFGSAPNDIDLFVRFASPPTLQEADCVSANERTLEYCELVDPEAGEWYAVVDIVRGDSVGYQLTATLLPPSPPPPPLSAGDIVVSNFESHEVSQIAPSSGDRAITSSSLRGSGQLLAGAEGVALDRSGDLIVASPFNRSVLRVDLRSGHRTLVSGCADADCSKGDRIGEGPDFLAPRFVAVRSDDAHVIVADRLVAGVYALVDVDPLSGRREILSGCSDESCEDVVGDGPALGRLLGIVLEENGNILVADGQAVVRIDPQGGDREILSGCSDAGCSSVVGSGPEFGEPRDLVIDEAGELFVTYALEGAPFGALRRVDLQTGDRSLVSGCEDPGCGSSRGSGPPFSELFGITLALDGNLVVVDSGLDAAFRVNPASGDRTLVSGCLDEPCSQEQGDGTRLAHPIGVVVVPEPDGPLPGMMALGLFVSATLRGCGGRRAWVPRLRLPPSDLTHSA